jgi:hypothetical protein
VKPIQDLTAQIKDPNKMKEAQKMMGKRRTSDRGWSEHVPRRDSTTADNYLFESEEDDREGLKKDDGPIDEVDALLNVFYSFFSDKNQL